MFRYNCCRELDENKYHLAGKVWHKNDSLTPDFTAKSTFTEN